MHGRRRRSLVVFLFMWELLAIVWVVLEVVVWILPTRRHVIPPLSQVLMLVVEIRYRLRRVGVDSIIRVITVIQGRQYRC